MCGFGNCVFFFFWSFKFLKVKFLWSLFFVNFDVEGHESHGVHLCHNCGWPFPNPHPSSKHRRAHKKICGTIEGYKLSITEGQHHLNGSDDDHKAPGEFPSYGYFMMQYFDIDTEKY